MNKLHLIEKVTATLGRKKLAAVAVEAVLDTIARELAAGGTVTLTNFGTFKAVAVPAHTAHNPQTMETIHVPASTKARFVPGHHLAELVNGTKAVPVDGSAIAKAPKGSLTGGAR